MLSNNEKYILLESSLKDIYGLDPDSVGTIISLHKEIYSSPELESADGVLNMGMGVGLMILGCFVGKKSAVIGLPGIGAALYIASIAWGLVDVARGIYKMHEEYGKAAEEQAAMETAQNTISNKVAKNFPGSASISSSADKAIGIMNATSGTLLDKLDAIAMQFPINSGASGVGSRDSQESLQNNYGFDSELNITDPVLAKSHPKEYFNYSIGMDSQGKTVINKKANDEFMKKFETYWDEHSDLFYINTEKAKKEMLEEFKSYYYTTYFLPDFAAKLRISDASTLASKSSAQLGMEGKDKSGKVIDKDKYYASMGFDRNSTVTDKQLFGKYFSANTGLDLNYNPVNENGKALLKKMLSDPNSEYMKYMPAPAFLMVPEDRKIYAERAMNPNTRGQSRLGELGSAGGDDITHGQQDYGNELTASSANAVAGKSAGNPGKSNDASSESAQASVKSFGKDTITKWYNSGDDSVKGMLVRGWYKDPTTGEKKKLSPEDADYAFQCSHNEISALQQKADERRRLNKLHNGTLAAHNMTQAEYNKYILGK